ncbi:two pore channel protein 1-like [Harmonia axyridis]|uniref:two pore channel protein 1-like n=1 Tax=Harmonia axyridis TaxID=115357 RepID=UPI001E276FCC|nr:two pore channel protein 1-like [Harmonia axyridis]
MEDERSLGDTGYKSFSSDNLHNPSYGTTSSSYPPIEEMGSRSSLARDVRDDTTGFDHWEMNYHEAAIFLEEGENNEKFDSHPRHPSALPAYLLVHNSWYYGLDLASSLVLLSLALTEKPSIDKLKLPVGIHGTLELLALGVIGIELALKLRWIGWGTILKHKRTMVKCVTLVIMVMEALVVLVRQSSHFRITRALRPIFLVDTRACGAVRRFIRQILQSLPPILDMLVLLLFFVCSYALLGYYLFSQHTTNLYFRTLPDSFVSMFVLLTTANFPDVMMPSYAISKWSALFFISYISTVLYVLMNLMLAVVYETFTGIERDKFRKLLLHKRKACQLAFRLLVSKQSPNTIKFKQFQGLMRYYSPRTSLRNIILMFHLLNISGTGSLTEDEFLHIYDALSVKWRLREPLDPWFSSAWPPLRVFYNISRRIVMWKYFEHIIYTLILSNGVAMFVRIMEHTDNLQKSAQMFAASWDTFLFLTLFLLEALLKVIAIGWNEYVASGWNVFDMIVTLAALMGAILLYLNPYLTLVVILRPLRLLRLFKLKKRYRDIFGTLVLLSPLMWSTTVVMLVMYYFFSIIGMEFFAPYDLRNCCVNTTVEDFYKFSTNTTSPLGYYYLNNFSDLLSSAVTLFELTVVNNWFIVMDAYASVTNPYSRLFFMLFYLFTMVVLTIVVASVLEAFRFRIQYKKQTTKRDEEQMLHEEVSIDWNVLQREINDVRIMETLQIDFTPRGTTYYLGRRRRTREVLQRHMYSSEITLWLNEIKEEENPNKLHEIVNESQINPRLVDS